MNINWDSVWFIPVRTLIVYIVVLIGLRVSGKRQMGQMTPFDLVLLLLISNAVQNAMTGPDTSLLGGILAAATLLIANQVVGYARNRIPRLRHFIVGSPTILIQDGELLKANLEHEEIPEEEILAALREHGIDDVTEVELATLEVDGSISVVPIASHHPRAHKRAVRFIKPSH
jgi:uncharacterized membrane protein YcaP (DUF421 family)